MNTQQPVPDPLPGGGSGVDSIRDISLQACRNTTLLALISSSENVSGNQGDSSRALYCTGFSVDDCDLPACVCGRVDVHVAFLFVCVVRLLLRLSRPVPSPARTSAAREEGLSQLETQEFRKYSTVNCRIFTHVSKIFNVLFRSLITFYTPSRIIQESILNFSK